MMDSTELNELLHSDIQDYYKVKPGEFLQIDLPRIPLTEQTEFLQLKKETRGDQYSFIEQKAPSQGEGSLLPRQIIGKAASPGKYHITLHAIDSLSEEEISDVKPLDITVEVEEE